ncbi:MAG: alpha-amylase [Deltaproteobacteria bacterium]|nr:alpha-amylase [Deltaproteobacteria bacterium]
MRLRSILPFALAMAAMVATSCVDVSPDPELQVGNHVDDWRDEVIYQVLIDRFANGDLSNDYRVNKAHPARYHGGDWKGLADKLDYIQALGVTTLWISPIVRNVETDAGIDSYHGYWTQDPFLLNQHFGNLHDLQDLVRRAHRRKIKVVLDIVTNHMGQLFYYDINQNGRPDESVQGGIKTAKNPGGTVHITEYDPDYEAPVVQSFTSLGNAGPAPIIFIRDPAINRIPPQTPEAWILATAEGYHRRGRIVNYDAPPDGTEQTMFGDFPGGLKDVATEDPRVRDVMLKAYGRWIQLADLDGFRIDTVKHVEHEFWEVWSKGIRDKAKSLGKPKFLLFGEVFDGKDDLVGSYTGVRKDAKGTRLPDVDELDGLFDFPQYFQVFRDVFIGGGPTTKIAARWTERASNWSKTPPAGGIGVAPVEAHVNFLDNHDVGRFLWQASGSGREKDKLAVLHNALAFLLTEDGIPCIYYGTEQNFSGGNDPSNREDLWLSGYDKTNETFQRIARLNRVRAAVPALRRGDMQFTWTTDHVADESDAGIVAFERFTADGSYALVVINTNAAHASTTEFGANAMKVRAPEGLELADYLPPSGGQKVTVTGGTVKITVPPTSAVILLPSSARI